MKKAVKTEQEIKEDSRKRALYYKDFMKDSEAASEFSRTKSIQGSKESFLQSFVFETISYSSNIQCFSIDRKTGKKIPVRRSKIFVAFVPQDEFLVSTCTVYETVLFSARLRLDLENAQEEHDMSAEELYHSKVEETLRFLGLWEFAHFRVGSPDAGGISGGQRRRLSIAVELVTNPDILIMDEPTSHLDYRLALDLMEELRSIAITMKCAIIISIHQPSEKICDLVGQSLAHDKAWNYCLLRNC